MQDGRIAARVAGALTAPAGAVVLDARGLVVTPGLVDIHTHLRTPGFPEKETIESGTAAAAAGGFTTVCAMANTDPVVDTVEVLESVQDACRRGALVRVRQLAAVTHGLRGERLTDFEALARAGAVAFSDDGKPVWDVAVMRAALRAAGGLDMVVSVHEEDRDLVGPGVAHSGAAGRHRLPPWPCAGEAAMVARDIELAAETGGKLHIAHVSCAETVEVLRSARRRDLPVSAEVTPHHLSLTERLLDGDASIGLPAASPRTKVNPPLRSEADVEALITAVGDGTIDAVATDHAPHTAVDKASPFETAAFGFTGLETALPVCLGLVRAGHLALPRLIELLTIGPARIFGLPSSLQPGSPADVCVFDPTEAWTVSPENLRSRGKNTPLLGRTVRGRVRWTLVAGRIVFPAWNGPTYPG